MKTRSPESGLVHLKQTSHRLVSQLTMGNDVSLHQVREIMRQTRASGRLTVQFNQGFVQGVCLELNERLSEEQIAALKCGSIATNFGLFVAFATDAE